MELVNKYAWLLVTIHQAERITFEEINQKWQEDWEENKPLPLRTFHNWKEAVQRMFNLNIDCDRRTNEYYISTPKALERDGLRRWLLETLSLVALLRENSTLSPRILLEEVPSAQQHLSEIIAAMKANRRLQVGYRSFQHTEIYSFEVEPYCIKCFKQRWYMLARSVAEDRLRVYALDRICDLEVLKGEKFSLPKSFSAADYFAEYFGIIPAEDVELEQVVLKVSATQSQYLRTLPLHASQEETESGDEESCLFTYHLRPTYDFSQQILSLGSEAEVLKPQWLREEIAEEVRTMWAMYKEKN